MRSIGSCASANSVQNIPPITADEDEQAEDRMGERLVEALASGCRRPSRCAAVDAVRDRLVGPAPRAPRSPPRPSGVCAGRRASSTSATIDAQPSTPSPRRAMIGTTGQPRSARQRRGVERQPAPLREVDHVQRDDDRHAVGEQLADQHEIARQVARVDDDQRRRRAWRYSPWPASTLAAIVASGRRQAELVEAGQVDDLGFDGRGAVGQRRAPDARAVVVPGKLEVLARAPHRRLKRVVLPVFGLPMRAMR